MFVNIDFDNKSAVASISLEGWAQPLVEFLARYFTIHKDMLHLDYSHLSTVNSGVRVTDWLYGWHTEREHFTAQHGQIALTLKILGHGPTGIEKSRSILDQTSYRCAQETFSDCILNGDPSALRETIVAKIEPRAIWVEWLLENRSCSRNKYLADHQIMKALMVNTSEEDCIYVLQLVAPTHGGNNWAFDQLIQQHWQCVCDYLKKNIDRSSDYSSNRRPEFVLTLFENSSKVQTSRWVCEQVFERAAPAVFTELIEHCCAILPEDVRNLFLRWNIHSKKDDLDPPSPDSFCILS